MYLHTPPPPSPPSLANMMASVGWMVPSIQWNPSMWMQKPPYSGHSVKSQCNSHVLIHTWNEDTSLIRTLFWSKVYEFRCSTVSKWIACPPHSAYLELFQQVESITPCPGHNLGQRSLDKISVHYFFVKPFTNKRQLHWACFDQYCCSACYAEFTDSSKCLDLVFLHDLHKAFSEISPKFLFLYTDH